MHKPSPPQVYNQGVFWEIACVVYRWVWAMMILVENDVFCWKMMISCVFKEVGIHETMDMTLPGKRRNNRIIQSFNHSIVQSFNHSIIQSPSTFLRDCLLVAVQFNLRHNLPGRFLRDCVWLQACARSSRYNFALKGWILYYKGWILY